MGLGLIVLVLLNSTTLGAQKKVVIKIATIAPDGSAWMQLFNEINCRKLKGECKPSSFNSSCRT